MAETPKSEPTTSSLDFIRERIIEDIRTGKYGGQVVTRFPPEPNGYLHIGHAKAICLNFGIAQEFGGRCHLRMDDTNPVKEDREYIEAIKRDVKWLGFDWGPHLYYASDYFDQLLEWAIVLIKAGKAYVDDLSPEEVSRTRGGLSSAGRDSPYRNRSVEENLDLFQRMVKGEFPDGSRTLRARIDMTSGNINLRDPVMYRILHVPHPHAGDRWCVYPTYDWAHGQSDWIEGITHSICTLEFENHRPLYDWFLDTLRELGVVPRGSANGGQPVTYRPQQIEFARLNLTYTVLSKRKLLELVKGGYVQGWDDPRMPTISGFRRRGYTPEAIRNFAREVGVTRFDSIIDIQRLENALREDLNKRAPRRMAVLNPLKLVIDNWPEGRTEQLDAVNNPEDPSAGTRKVPFGKVVYIEQDDFREVPPPKYFRLAPGQEVRLRWAYIVKCTHVIKDPDGRITEVHCTYDPATRGGDTPDGRKVKGTIHWVSAEHALDAEVRLYDHLFRVPEPEAVPEGKSYLENLNPNSLVVVRAKLEPSLKDARPDEKFQFERHGYFVADVVDSRPGAPVFNRSVALRDSWAKLERRGSPAAKG
ncbi:glutamine--tRNA ligase/YqeY domain fusion protein [Fontivita pretiosa]|uniref:glutamine--tRNA ligase/YqeY domain fusion protein n=1 Tax=Fontivita pretiosa TaxID=2989684 RepID=UPI003D17CEB8